MPVPLLLPCLLLPDNRVAEERLASRHGRLIDLARALLNRQVMLQGTFAGARKPGRPPLARISHQRRGQPLARPAPVQSCIPLQRAPSVARRL